MTRVRMADDGCGCIEFWHEHKDAPIGSVPSRADDGQMTHWLRMVNMVDRVACPLGDFEILGNPAWLVGREPDRLEAS